MIDDQSTYLDEEATQFTYFAQEDHTELGAYSTIKTEEEGYISLDPGTIFLGKYKILKVLGNGNFGMIYLLEANDASKKLLVVKEFFPKGYVKRGANGEMLLKQNLTQAELNNFNFMKEIFIGEAKNLVKVTSKSHTNIVTFFSLEDNKNNTVYFIMNYEEGVSLKEYLNKSEKERLSNKEVYRIALPLLNGLEHIHKAGIYHQDIKLENILIREDGSPILLDFGASVIFYDKKDDKYFNAATPKYAAIEQINVDKPPKINQTTDIYAMGVLLYRLVSGTFPPKSKDRMDAIIKGKRDPYKPLARQKHDGYDTRLIKSIDKALQLSQDDRFQSASEFSDALRNKKKILIYLMPVFVFVALMIYFLSPTQTGRLKLDISTDGYEVYIDGEKRLLERDKTIALNEGEHKVAIVKNGYVPFEKSVKIGHGDIANISVDMMPVEHIASIETNIGHASVIVNGRILNNNKFKARYGEKYTISIAADGYSTIRERLNYKDLYKSKFKLYFNMLVDRVNVDINIAIPLKIGVTHIKINGVPIRGHVFVARKDKEYNIDIFNPYYEPLKITKTFSELYNNTILNISLVQGMGKINLNIEPDGAKVILFKVVDGEDIQINKKAIYAQKGSVVDVSSSDKMYIIATKEGYDTIRTRLFSVKNGETVLKQIHLTKTKKGTIDTLMQVGKAPLEGEFLAVKGQYFSIAKFETTYKQFARFMNGSKEGRANRDTNGNKLYGNKIFKYIVLGQDGYIPRRGYRDYPVGYVTWYGAKAYIAWLNKITGKKYLLPSNEQWTKAASEGFEKNMLDLESNYNTGTPLKVGTKKANKQGVYDLFGNVFEWTSTSSGKEKHIIKGGSFRSKYGFLSPEKSGVEYNQNENRADLGFRVMLMHQTQ